MTAALEMALDLRVRWRGGELDRLLDQDHADLGNSVSAALNGLGWSVRPEVSFSVYGERGVIDVLAWRPNTGALLVIELKTSIPDLQNLLATLDRKARLAPTVASRIGWQSRGVSAVVILAAGRTNRARVARHRSVLEAALPADGRTVRAWLRRPAGEIRGLTYWPILTRCALRQLAAPNTGFDCPGDSLADLKPDLQLALAESRPAITLTLASVLPLPAA